MQKRISNTITNVHIYLAITSRARVKEELCQDGKIPNSRKRCFILKLNFILIVEMSPIKKLLISSVHNEVSVYLKVLTSYLRPTYTIATRDTQKYFLLKIL